MNNLAVVFPGQGSQKIGMLAELAEHYPLIKKTFLIASEVLGFDLWQLVQQGPENDLNRTANTQPAILAASFALWQLWHELKGPTPKLIAGHSLGEYTALVCANVIPFTVAVDLVHQRGLFMQQAVNEGAGAMAAIIGLDDDKIAECCKSSQQFGVVSPANFNAIGQTVIAGEKPAVEYAATQAKTAGARKVVMLAVSVPSHCSLMASAADKLNTILQDITFNNAEIPIINNVSASIETDATTIKNALIKQLVEPVQWVKTIQLMAIENIRDIIECGPGKVLTGMNKRIDKNINYFHTDTLETFQKTLKTFNEEQ